MGSPGFGSDTHRYSANVSYMGGSSLQTLWHTHLPPSTPTSIESKLPSHFQKQAVHNFLKHCVLESEGSLICIPMCMDHSKCGEDSRRHRPPPGEDKVCLQEALEKAQGASSSRTGIGGGGDEASSLFLLSLHPVHPKEELI